MLALRVRQAPLLAGPALRVAAGPAAVAAAGVLLVLCAPESAPPLARWPGWAAAALAIPLVSLLDDPGRQLAAGSPTPLPVRRGVRLVLGLAVAALVWLVVPGGDSVQAAALVAVALGTGALGLRAGFGDRARLAAMLAPLAVVAATLLLGGGPATTGPEWPALLTAGTVALIWASRPE